MNLPDISVRQNLFIYLFILILNLSLLKSAYFPCGENIIVGTIYLPIESKPVEFLEKFNELISLISKDNKHCYVMCDFNNIIEIFYMYVMMIMPPHKNLWIVYFLTCSFL